MPDEGITQYCKECPYLTQQDGELVCTLLDGQCPALKDKQKQDEEHF